MMSRIYICESGTVVKCINGGYLSAEEIKEIEKKDTIIEVRYGTERISGNEA